MLVYYVSEFDQRVDHNLNICFLSTGQGNQGRAIILEMGQRNEDMDFSKESAHWHWNDRIRIKI